MIELLKSNRMEIAARCQHFGVARLEVFGSAARGDFDATSSDLDFLVEFEEYGPGIADRYFGFIRSMEEYFGGKVDTVFGPNVKNPILQEEIDRNRELLYDRKAQKSLRDALAASSELVNRVGDVSLEFYLLDS